MSFVTILMGSESDWPVMQACTAVLEQLAIDFEVRVTSTGGVTCATATICSSCGCPTAADRCECSR